MKKLFISLLTVAATLNVMATSSVTIQILDNEGWNSELILTESTEGTLTAVVEPGNSIALYAVYDSKKCEQLRLEELGERAIGFKIQATTATMTVTAASGAPLYMKTLADGTITELAKDAVINITIASGKVNTWVEDMYQLCAAPEEYIHHREVANGSFGTICFPNKITTMEGVKDGKLLEFVTNGVTFVEAQEVELANMEVGKAYIFEASADAQAFTYDPATSEASPIDNNGLVGTFAEDGIVIEADAWIIKGNAIKAVLAGSSVPQYRAYIPSLDDIQTIEPTPGAPVRRFLIGEATGLQEIKAMEGTRKAIVNGRLVIIREGRMFNALGGRK